MAVPKRRMSRSRTRHRRSQWTAAPADLVPVTRNGRTTLIPRRLITQFHRLADEGREL